jgi:ribosomal protein S27AE
MKCEKCNNLMILEQHDDFREYWICERCGIGFLAHPKKNCEHDVDSIIFGVNNIAWCEDCGNILTYEPFCSKSQSVTGEKK